MYCVFICPVCSYVPCIYTSHVFRCCVFMHPVYSYILGIYTSCILICTGYLYILYTHMYWVFIHPVYSYVLGIYTSCILICTGYLYMLYVHTNLYSYLFCSVKGDKNALFTTSITYKSTRPTAPAHTELVTWLANGGTILIIPYWTAGDTLPTSIAKVDLEIATLLTQERSLWCARRGEVKRRIEVVLRVCA